MSEKQQTHGAVIAARIGLFLGPILLLACLLSEPPEGLGNEAWLTAGLIGLMATWWATEAIPFPQPRCCPSR